MKNSISLLILSLLSVTLFSCDDNKTENGGSVTLDNYTNYFHLTDHNRFSSSVVVYEGLGFVVWYRTWDFAAKNYDKYIYNVTVKIEYTTYDSSGLMPSCPRKQEEYKIVTGGSNDPAADYNAYNWDDDGCGKRCFKIFNYTLEYNGGSSTTWPKVISISGTITKK